MLFIHLKIVFPLLYKIHGCILFGYHVSYLWTQLLNLRATIVERENGGMVERHSRLAIPLHVLEVNNF